jgi:thiaminase
MHKMTFKELFQTEYAPTNYAYTRHYLSIDAMRLPRIVPLMLPCLWLYDEIDKKMNIDFGPYN